MIIEPGELAHDEDHGPTQSMPGRDHKGRADPSQQAAEISCPGPKRRNNSGIDPERFTAAIQFGSQRNFDYEESARAHRQGAARPEDVQLLQIDNPLAPPSESEISRVAVPHASIRSPSTSARST